MSQAAQGMLAPAGTLWGYPKGVFLLSFTELWERFSYYGLMALLVLYLSATTAEGGFGWTQEEAIKLFGLYSGLAFAGPVLGGWIASRYWGERRCIQTGAALIVLGHVLLAGPAIFPWVARHLGSTADLARHLGVGAFFCGLAFVILGTALIKPTVSSLVGRFFPANDPRRDGAFAVFFTGIYVGVIAGVLVAGYLGEHWGWHWGFASAGFGMAIGLAVYLSKQHAYLADIGIRPPFGRSRATPLRRFTAEEWDRIKVLFLQGAITALFTAGANQAGARLTLFARDHVDRWVGGWQLPASWILLSGSCLFVIGAPTMARIWEGLAKAGRNPSAATKLAWGVATLGVGYAIITLATQLVPYEAGVKVPLAWMVATYACFGFADVLVYGNQISLTSKLAPQGLTAVFVGGWYLQTAIGNAIAGYIGARSYSWGLEPVLMGSALTFLVLGALVWMATPALVRRMHGIEA